MSTYAGLGSTQYLCRFQGRQGGILRQLRESHAPLFLLATLTAWKTERGGEWIKKSGQERNFLFFA